MTRLNTVRRPLSLCLIASILAIPFGLVACDRTESESKTSKTTTTQTPEGTKKTTETTEKKVETSPK